MSMIKPLINGNMYQFSSIVLTVNGVPFDLITGVNYSSTNESAQFYGTSKTPISQTKGILKHEASVTVPVTARDALLELITKGGTRGWADSPFTVTVSYAEEGAPVTTDVLDGCRILSMSKSHSQSNEALNVELTLSVPTIVYGNGKFRPFVDAI